jgi:small conductance mechanosensitive channel
MNIESITGMNNKSFIRLALRFLLASSIVLLAIPLSSSISNAINRRSLEKTSLDRNKIYVDLFSAIIRYLIVFSAIVSALKIMLFDTTAILSALGIFGLGISLALQDSMKDFVSGIFLIFFDHFRTGDMIKTNGMIGKVKAFRFFNTTLDTNDISLVEIPNSKIWSSAFINISRLKNAILSTSILISNENNLKEVEEVILNFLKKNSLSDGKFPFVEFIKLNSIGTTLKTYAKIKSKDYQVRSAQHPKLLKLELQKSNFILLDGNAARATRKNEHLVYKSSSVKPYML